MLELLLLKGNDAQEISRKFAYVYEFTPRATAKKLAEMYMNSLIGTRDISIINEDEPIEEYNPIDRQTRYLHIPVSVTILSTVLS